MAGFPIELPDGSRVNIVRKEGSESNERFTDEDGNVYMKNQSGGMSRSFVLVESGVTLVGFEEGEEPSVDQDVQPVTEDEPADGAEVYAPDDDDPVDPEPLDPETVIGITFESGDEAQVEPEEDDDPYVDIPEIPEDDGFPDAA